MYKDLEGQNYDFLIIGTGLTESALSAFLSKSKYKIMQIDISKSYGGDCKNFNLRDMEKFVEELNNKSSKDSSIKNISVIKREIKQEFEPVTEKENFRLYNFDLNPKFIYARSKSSAELVDSKASNYIEFNSVRKLYFMFNDKFLNVPFSKSEIFISNDLDLLEKQKLLNFIFSIMKLKNKVDVNSTVDIKKDIELDDDLLFNEIKKNLNVKAKDFLQKNFNEKIIDMILLILANQTLNTQNMTVDQMCDQIYKFLISVQIYDNTPFLIPQYGSSEFTQAMSRLSAVYGSIFLINDCLECNINYNKDYNKDNKESKKFIVEMNDTEKNEKFKFNVDKIIVNNSFLDDKDSKIKFNEEIKMNNTINNYVYKYSAFYVIRNITDLLTDKDGPFYYRVPKNNTLLKNDYQLDAIRYFNNTCTVANNRTMIQISIFSDLNEKDENVFAEKAKIISENFVKKIVDDLKEEIMNNYNNKEFKSKCKFRNMRIIEEIDREKEDEEKKKKEEEEKKKKEEEEKKKKEEEEKKKKEEEEKKKKEEEEKKKKEEEKNGEKGEENKKEENKEEKKEEGKKDEEKKETACVYVPPKRPRTPPKIEEISLTPDIIMKYEFKQKLIISDYVIENKEKENNIIFTKNNCISVDLDEYFEESFNILKKFNLFKEEEKKEEKSEEDKQPREMEEDDDEDEDNHLIDELFGEIEIDEEGKKDEEKKEEKKDEEKKEEKKDEEKKEEKKDEEKKEEKKDEEKKEEKKDEEKKEDKKDEEKKEENKEDKKKEETK